MSDTQNSVLDGLAVLMALDRGDLESADAMLSTYHDTGEISSLMSALAAVALCAVRYSATTAGMGVDRLLAGVAQEVRAQAV